MRAQRWTALLLAAATATALAACSADPEADPPADETGDQAVEEVTITFQEQFNDEQSAAMEDLVAKFESENPGITVELLRDNDSAYYDKLVTQITGGQGPDIARVEPAKAPQYIASGWALPLDDVIDAGEYFPAALDAVTSDGQLYGVPLEVEGLGLFYRSDLLAEVGFDEPPATWEEFTEAATALTGDGRYGAGLFGGWGAFEFYPWLWQAGAEVLNEDGTEAIFNSPEAVEALQLWVDLQATAMPAGMATATEDDVKGPFISGTLGMFTSGPWAISALEEAGIDGLWSVAPLPAGAESATVLGGMDLLVLENSEHPDEAKAFLAWLMADENIRDYYLAVGGVPAKTTLFDDPAFAEDPYLPAFQDILDQARSRPTVAAAGDVDSALGTAVQAALAGTATPQEALDTAVAEANEALSD
jgi:ABC-type glycerol-3-phosphate transport system substrate-binding protein